MTSAQQLRHQAMDLAIRAAAINGGPQAAPLHLLDAARTIEAFLKGQPTDR